MRITKWGEYGILCSLYLAKQHGAAPVGAAEIAEAEKIPVQYTQQILQRLRRGNIIESARGPHGGYSLAREPDKITLKQILDATEGDTFQVICHHNPPDTEGRCNPANVCSLRNVWEDLKVSIDAMLSSKTLAHLVLVEQEAQSGHMPKDMIQISSPPKL